MTVEELKKISDDKYAQYVKARKAYNDAICNKFVDKYKGKYIRFRHTSGDVPCYMYVYNIWNSVDDSGPFKVPILYFEGVYFTGCISEYVDSKYFSWDKFIQEKFNLHDFDDVTLEYRSASNELLIEIITKEEYFAEFHALIEKVVKEHTEFEYNTD